VADVYDQNGWAGVEFVNSNGCHTTKDFSAQTITDPDGVHYVYIRLYACNSNGCSSIVNSRLHYNPYW
jgi:hypothetical protein